MTSPGTTARLGGTPSRAEDYAIPSPGDKRQPFPTASAPPVRRAPVRRARGGPWYVRPALEGRAAHAGTRRAVAAALLSLALVAAAGCGGGPKRQDANEPRGDFKVDVVEAKFPERQKLARRSEMRIVVRNADTKRIPNIAVTVKSFDRKENDTQNSENAAVSVQPQLADPERPVFIVNQSPIEFFQKLGAGKPSLVDREVDPPRGTESAGSYVDTYALGPLKPGETKVFKWSVTAVVAGPYKLDYRVEAGLDGKARAVVAGGGAPTGRFEGVIEDRPFDAGVDPAGGEAITREGEEIGPKPFDRSNGPNDN